MVWLITVLASSKSALGRNGYLLSGSPTSELPSASRVLFHLPFVGIRKAALRIWHFSDCGVCVCVTLPASSKSAFGGNASRVPPVTLMDFTLEVRPAGRLSEGSGLLGAWAPPGIRTGKSRKPNHVRFPNDWPPDHLFGPQLRSLLPPSVAHHSDPSSFVV